MATLSSVLAQIRQNESGGNYTAQNPSSSASGAYQFVNGTWQSLTQKSGIGTQYATAGSAPPATQDAVAAYALTQNPNANSCSLWGTCNAAGQVIGPARYPVVDSFDTSPTQLAATANGGALAQSGSGFGYSPPGQTFYTYTAPDGSQGLLADPSFLPEGATLGQALPQAPANAQTGASQTGAAGVGTPVNVGLQSGTQQTIAGVGTNIASAIAGVGTKFQTAATGWFASLENWLGRGFLILIGLVILALALWRVMESPPQPATA